MTDSKYTPGKWKFKTAANGDCGISAEGTGVFIECFAEIRHAGENARSEALANAKLVVAIPDLLSALLECEAYFDNRADADCDQDGFIPNEEMKLLSEVREAIAKATA